MGDEKGYLNILLDEKTSRTSFVFYWQGLEEPVVAALHTPANWIKHYKDRFKDSLNELIFEDIEEKILRGTDLEKRLIALGYDVWEIFPRELQQALRQFDRKARRNGVLASKSRLVLIIRTDIFFVPWGLCIAPKETGEEPPAGDAAWFHKSWYFKYHVALVHPLVPSFEGISRREVLERERNRVLLIRELPSPYDKEYTDIVCKEYPDIVNKLGTLIENLRARGIEIDDEGYRDRFELAQKMRGRGNQKYDMILFMGGFVEKSGLDALGQMQIVRMKRPLLMDVAEIRVGRHLKPVLFLDACKTYDVSSYSSVGDYIECATTLAGKFLQDGACAFIGTMQKIEPEVASLFALEFLSSVFNYGSSLAKAMHDARTKTYEFFSEERLKSRSLFFRLCGCRQEEDLLTDSFRFGFKRSSLQLIYNAEASGEYFDQFNIDIYPSSIPGVELVRKTSFPEVEKEIARAKGPFIADLPTLSAARIIAESKKADRDNPLTIIGSLLRVRADLSTSLLYYVEDDNLDSLRNSLLEHPGDTSMVTMMALMYFKQLGLADRFLTPGYRRTRTYNSMFDFAKECIESGHMDFLFPFLLASAYEIKFGEFLEEEIKKGRIVVEEQAEAKTILKVEVDEEQGRKINIARVDLNRFFFNLPSCRSMQSIPAQVLIARKKDYDENHHLYREVVTKWENWRRDLLQYTDIARSQDVIVSFTGADQQAIIAFTKLVAEEIGPDYVRIVPLTNQDFCIIRPWGEMGEDFEFPLVFGELKNECKEVLGELYTDLEKLEHAKDLKEEEAKKLRTIDRAESEKIGLEVSAITDIINQYDAEGRRLKQLIDATSDLHQLRRTLRETQELVKEFERTSTSYHSGRG